MGRWKSTKCLDRESNTGPQDLQSCALPTELSRLYFRCGSPNGFPYVMRAVRGVSHGRCSREIYMSLPFPSQTEKIF
eukprot:scaffold27541_cov31-Attheya_sp.AAC.1